MSLQDVVRTLASSPTLRDLDAEALRLIAFSAESRILRAGDTLFQLGDTSDGGFVVLSGEIAMDNGARTVIVRPPALIGDSALLAETMCSATATAREPTSILKISRALFHRVLAEYPDSAVTLHRSLIERLVTLDRDLADVGSGMLRDEGSDPFGLR